LVKVGFLSAASPAGPPPERETPAAGTTDTSLWVKQPPAVFNIHSYIQLHTVTHSYIQLHEPLGSAVLSTVLYTPIWLLVQYEKNIS